MADAHHTAERAAWVTARAGRRAGARRRAERLTTRARRLSRYEAGAGDAPMGEVSTRSRFGRIAIEHEEHRARWFLFAVLIEGVRMVVAGPGLTLGQGIYALWYRKVPTWGPIRWQTLAIACGVVTGLTVVVGGVLWLGASVPWWGWWVLAQPVIGTARAAWLAHAFGWEAVPHTARLATPALVKIHIPEDLS